MTTAPAQLLIIRLSNFLIFPKSSLKLISWTCLRFWLTSYLLCLVGMIVNRQSTLLCILTVLLCSSTSSRPFNFTFRYIEDVLSLNNTKFGDFIDRIYPIELEIKDTIDAARSASYLDPRYENRIRTKLYDKRDDFNIPIVNFPLICSNIPALPAYEVNISQLIWHSRACGSYYDFLDRGLPLTRKLLNQGFLVVKLKSLLRTFCEWTIHRNWQHRVKRMIPNKTKTEHSMRWKSLHANKNK